MPLLNYTTSVAVHRSTAEVQRMLVRAGAEAITATFDQDGVPTGLSFVINGPLGQRAYSLPVRTNAVAAVLDRQQVERRYRTPEHAQRVAWRIVKDWLAAQLALLETEMVTLDQIMLPYMHTDERGTTVYQRYRAQAAGELPEAT